MKKCSSTQVFPYPPSCSKEAYTTGSNFLYLPLSSALRLSGVDDVRWVQRKSVLQLAICVSCTQHVLVQKSFQLACNLNFPPKNHFLNCPSGKLRTEFTSLQQQNPPAPGYRTPLSLHAVALIGQSCSSGHFLANKPYCVLI